MLPTMLRALPFSLRRKIAFGMLGMLSLGLACGRTPQPTGSADAGSAAKDSRPARERGIPDIRQSDGPAGDGGIPLQQAIKACTIAASCAEGQSGIGITWPLFTPGACLDALGQLGWYRSGVGGVTDPDLVKLLLNCAVSSDCAKVMGCMGGSWFTLSRCREGATCKGNKLVPPAKSKPSFNCSAIGAKCMDLWSGAQRACCNAQSCSGANKVTCQGTRGTFCHGWGAHLDFDCGLTGRVCSTDPLSFCKGTGGTCANGKTPTICMGKAATFCSGGRLATVDCGRNLFRNRCAAGDLYRVCVPSGKACDPAQYLGQCAGSGLKICLDGLIVSVDCKKLGFNACDLPAGAAARCINHP